MREGSMDGVVCWVNNDVCSLCLVKFVFVETSSSRARMH
jgi:hypothetical protein